MTAIAAALGLDTNVLVRFLVQDDAVQAEAATALIGSLTEAAPGFVSREVLVELVWVLERAYNLGRADIARALDGLLEALLSECNHLAWQCATECLTGNTDWHRRAQTDKKRILDVFHDLRV